MDAARAPAALPPDPASAGCCAQSSLTLSDLSQIAPFFTSSNRSDYGPPATKTIPERYAFKTLGYLLFPERLVTPLVRLQFFISFGENRKTEAEGVQRFAWSPRVSGNRKALQICRWLLVWQPEGAQSSGV